MNWRKRVLDLTVSIPVFVLSLPVQVVAAGTIAVTMGRPVIFSQDRPGLNGKPFKMRKFRTMRPVDSSRGWTDDASRLTALGRILRSTSIDELPTLWNVIVGDMSLVGPRPLLMQYVNRYNTEQARRMEVKPGLTGLAQISGRNNQSWEERFRYDVLYVDRHSIQLDIYILCRTLLTVLRREGISADGAATMHEFRGTEDEG